jgi:hypothetical protein
MAYLNPVVDNSTEKFTWAVPNFVAVRDYAGMSAMLFCDAIQNHIF